MYRHMVDKSGRPSGPRDLAVLVAAVALLWAGSATAQSTEDEDLSQAEGLEEEYGRDWPEDEELAQKRAPDRQWTLQLRLPIDWRTNLTQVETGRRSGDTIGPDLSVSRRWNLGGLQLFTEAGGFSSTVLRDASLDTAGFYGTFELQAGSSVSKRLTPYVAYEPFSLYDGLFQSHIVKLHTFSAGVRRASAPTFLDAYLRRMEASADSAERWGLGTTVSHSIGLGGDTILNLRGEAEFRRYDELEGQVRRDFRIRARARIIVPLDPAVDLQLTADLHRSRSNTDGRNTTNLILGPALVARLGF